MFISTCGFGATGSSAVTDYLRECEGIQVIDKFEFRLPSAVDGLSDLEYHIMLSPARQSSSAYAIQRFEKLIGQYKKKWCASTSITAAEVDRITYEFLDQITQVRYVSFSPRINKRHSEFLQRYVGESLIRRKIMPKLERKGIVKRNVDFYPLDEIRVSVCPPNFYEAAQTFVRDLLTGMGVDMEGNVAMDQAFVGNDPARGFPFFTDPYAVVVDRDPRDLFIFARKKLFSVGRFMPSDTVENFIAYYRILRENQPYSRPNPRVLSIRFEDMIYEYDATTARINEFLGIRNLNPRSVFNPAHSVANTNLVTKFPDLRAETEQIAQALPEYLYPFEKYPDVSNEGKMFFGRALRKR